jgi:hypothetical protein
VRYTTRPLTPEARNRMTGRGTEMSPFRSTWTSTETLLERELRHLHPRGDIVLMVDVTEADIRNDGKIRATARPASSATAITFTSTTKGALLFCCGRYRGWQDNVRAIALGLEALRKIERYGIVQSDEQYRGWRAITAGGEWATVLARYSGWNVEHVHADPDGAYRAAVKTAHPDYGGTRATFAEVQDARRRAG